MNTQEQKYQSDLRYLRQRKVSAEPPIVRPVVVSRRDGKTGLRAVSLPDGSSILSEYSANSRPVSVWLFGEPQLGLPSVSFQKSF
jgi:molybdenum-dependent DNA-binding transcriptional regulator ModE